MEKINYFKIILSLTVGLFLFSGASNTALGGYGGEGGEGAVDTTRSKPATKITKLSDAEIRKIFSMLDARSRDTFSSVFSGTSRTARDLMSIRQAVLEGDMQRANAEASLINGLTITVEYLDKAGQWSQLGLSFVPGVGWVTAGLLDTARGGVDAYRDGKSATEIFKDATIAGVASVTINKLSPLGADKTFKGAKRAWNMATKGSGKRTAQAVKAFVTNVSKYGVKKETERRAGNAVKAALNNATKQTPNRVPRPTYMGTMGFDVTPTGQKLYK